MDYDMMNSLVAAIDQVGSAIESIGVKHGSADIYTTWGQVLYEEDETLIEDLDWVRVRLEMVMLDSFHFCVYLIWEECFVDGHAYINRFVAEHGQVGDRFLKIRKAAEQYVNWQQYWKSIKRSDVQEGTNG